MKVIYIHQYFNTPNMVGSLRSFEMARHLVESGHEVHMLTLWRDDAKSGGWFKSDEAGISVHWLPICYSNKMSYFKRLVVFLKFMFHASRKAIEIGGDVVFATSTPLTVVIPAVIASRRLKAPFVFEVRDLWPDIPIELGVIKSHFLKCVSRWVERQAYERSEHIIALSSDMKRAIIGKGVSQDKVTGVPNMADTDRFKLKVGCNLQLKKLIWPEVGDKKVVLYPGTFGYVNGLLYMVEMAKEANEQGITGICFVAVGDGAEAIMVKEAATKMGVLGKNFFVFPSVPKSEMSPMFIVADIILSLVINKEALWANSANKFFDALASATPIAINYKGWQAELINRTGCGIVLSPGKPKHGIIDLNKLLASEERMALSGSAALCLAREKFSRDLLVGRFEQILLDHSLKTK